MASRQRRSAPLEASLRHELGLAPTEQLELAEVQLEPSAFDHLVDDRDLELAVVSPPCGSCGRWNYHLVGCPQNGSEAHRG